MVSDRLGLSQHSTAQVGPIILHPGSSKKPFGTYIQRKFSVLRFTELGDFIHFGLFLLENQNQNSLLVTRQIDNPSPGAVTGGN